MASPTEQIDLNKKLQSEGLTDEEMAKLEAAGQVYSPEQAAESASGWGAIGDLGVGAAKQTGRMALSLPLAADWLLEKAGVPSNPKFQEWNQALEPKGTPQEIGAETAEALSYFLPVGAEANLAGKGTRAIMKYARPVRRALGAPGARATLGGANALIRGGVGAGTNAAIAAANQENPVPAAVVGGTFPAVTSAAEPAFTWAGGKLRDTARNAMARAIQPGSKVDKFTARKILDPLLEEGRVWWTPKGLLRIAQEHIGSASAKKAAARATMSPDAALMYDDVQQALKDRREEAFLSGRSGQGQPMANIPEETRAAETFDKIVQNYIEPKRTVGPTGDFMMPFDELDLTKRRAQDYAASHGKAFLDLPRDPISSAESQALEQVSHASRPLLEDFAPPEWSEANKELHTFLAIADLAEESMGKKLGQKTPLAERMVGGYGWKMGAPSTKSEIPGMLTRAYRRLVDSPGWQSTTAQMKDWAANRFLQASGRVAGAGGSYAASHMGGPQQGQKAKIEENPQVAPPMAQDLYFDVKTGTWTTKKE